MNTATQQVGRVQAAPRPWPTAVGVLAFAALTAAAARIAVPLPGTPVPFTFGPLAVLLCGMLLGSRNGARAQALYLAAGAAGLPVFAAGGGAAYLLGPTGGYLLAYPAAAWLVGRIGGERREIPQLLLAGVVGLAAIYGGGLLGLARLGSLTQAAAWGVMPFVAADLVEVGLAAAATRRLRGGSVER